MGICLPSGALNFNYEGDRAEQELRGISFDIADEWTVRRLMIEETDLLRYDNLLGESGQLDVSSFASTDGRVITLNKFFFDDSDYLIKSYDDEGAEGFFAKGTS